jgi:hypothetical protein
MRRFYLALSLTLAVMSILLSTLGALAQERAGDAALGALSGAVVLGPVGAVAGAVIGYTAGPSISHSWGLRRSEPHYPERVAQRTTTMTSDKGTSTSRASGRDVSLQSAITARSATKAATQTAAETVSAPPRSIGGTSSRWDAPPVQGLE